MSELTRDVIGILISVKDYIPNSGVLAWYMDCTKEAFYDEPQKYVCSFNWKRERIRTNKNLSFNIKVSHVDALDFHVIIEKEENNVVSIIYDDIVSSHVNGHILKVLLREVELERRADLIHLATIGVPDDMLSRF